MTSSLELRQSTMSTSQRRSTRLRRPRHCRLTKPRVLASRSSSTPSTIPGLICHRTCKAVSGPPYPLPHKLTRPALHPKGSVCSGPPPFCGSRLNFVGASADASAATSWSIVNGSLFDNSDNAACYFDSAADNGYTLVCNSAGAVSSAKPVDIDCFGNLQTYFNNSNTWAVYNGLPVGIFPQPDPVHHYNESGDSPYVGDLKYVQLQVVPLGS